MDTSDFLKWSEHVARWARDYHERLPAMPVRSQARPGELLNALPTAPPEHAEAWEDIFSDFDLLIPQGLTHWQHPRFFAYFAANASFPSMIAEQLATSLACNCMLWQTSPAATELEQRMTDWLRQAVGLPSRFTGLIQDSATTATLCAVLTMRERALSWKGNESGLHNAPQLRLYASPENHSSVDKAARLAGIGQENLVKPGTRKDRSLDPESLHACIRQDLDRGFLPVGVVGCIGGTATGACDRLSEILEIAREFNLYSHVDAAWAGSAMICKEFRTIWKGIEHADSVVFNPHKWLGVQFDCSIQFCADPQQQAATVGLRPDYLKTAGLEEITNLNEFTIPLGRRFRALKLWFAMRAHGLAGLRSLIRDHVDWIGELERLFAADPLFDVAFRSELALFGFRLADSFEHAERLTVELAARINDDGHVYLTPTVVDGRTAIRVTAGTFATTRPDVLSVHEIAGRIARELVS
ncbi:MAG: pyridoxal-dependent decarboxylase [Rhodobacteraceae bacterium]|nr:pyridoxal-dependent decarboxylase [Paracoccaceae bacterium]